MCAGLGAIGSMLQANAESDLCEAERRDGYEASKSWNLNEGLFGSTINKNTLTWNIGGITMEYTWRNMNGIWMEVIHGAMERLPYRPYIGGLTDDPKKRSGKNCPELQRLQLTPLRFAEFFGRCVFYQLFTTTSSSTSFNCW